MVSDVLATPALPHIMAHQAANAALAPDGSDPMAAAAQAHAQSMDQAKLGMAAQAQGHQQAMDVAGHALAAQQQAAQQAPAGG